jgi:UDP-N-acetylmuramoylalanine--D-glutamate ligase
MNKTGWQDKKILILGFGREGQVTLRFLRKEWPDAVIGVADLRSFDKFSAEEQELLKTIPPQLLFLGTDYLECLGRFEVIFKTPGENRRKPQIAEAIRQGVILTSATNLFFRLKKGRVIAVTGSKGKSTTASMIFQVLKTAGMKTELIGNIGKAALDFLDKDSPETIYVFEMSSYQLEDFQGGADIAVFVSFFPEHLDYHGDLEAYFKAKIQLAAQPKEGFKVIYNHSQERLRKYFDEYERVFKGDVKVIPFNDAVHSKIETENGLLTAKDHGLSVLNEQQIKLKGRHNLENILAVIKVAAELGIDNQTVARALADFKPLEHRLEMVGEYRGITFYDDAISTTPESTVAAIDALGRDRKIGTLIAGGLDRGYQFAGLANKIREAGIENLILLPETGIRIEEAVKESTNGEDGYNPVFIHCGDMESCVEKAYQITPKDSICLLSCASPSYNLFKNFEERGNKFKAALRSLANQ